MKARLVIIPMVLIGMFGFNSGSAKVSSERASHPASSSVEPQDRVAANAFDLSDGQPRSIYVASRDRTRVPRRRDPRLNQHLLRILNDDQITNVREQPIGSNNGPEVRTYLDYCRVPGPAWWCAAFVSFQIHQASLNSSVPSSWRPLANCVDIYNWGKKHNLLLAEPGVPSVMLIPGGRNQRKFVHTGFVVEYDPSTRTIVTIEGNSNNDGSSNGIGVFRLRRRVRPGMRFVKVA